MYIHIDLDCYFVSCERIKYPVLNNRPVVAVNGADSTIFDEGVRDQSLIDSEGAFTPNAIYDKYGLSETLHEYPQNLKHTSMARGCKCSFCQKCRDVFYDIKGGYFKGTVVAKSYEAKEYGIKTGTKLGDALALCPDLIALPQNYYDYYLRSAELKKFLHTKVPAIEQYSIDEFFGDLHGWVEGEDTKEFLLDLQKQIWQEFNLPVSIGASSGKWVAKLATDFAKPYGVLCVPTDQIERFIENIDIEEFPGIAKGYGRRLRDRGIHTLGRTKRHYKLFESWGKYGRDLYHRIHGTDREGVQKANSRQSVGISRMFSPVYERKLLLQRVAILASHLAYTVLSMGLTPTTYYFKLRYNSAPGRKARFTIYEPFSERFYKNLCREQIIDLDIQNDGVYGIILSVGNFVQNKPRSLSLLQWQKAARIAKLEGSMTKIRQKHGYGLIGYGV